MHTLALRSLSQAPCLFGEGLLCELVFISGVHNLLQINPPRSQRTGFIITPSSLPSNPPTRPSQLESSFLFRPTGASMGAFCLRYPRAPPGTPPHPQQSLSQPPRAAIPLSPVRAGCSTTMLSRMALHAIATTGVVVALCCGSSRCYVSAFAFTAPLGPASAHQHHLASSTPTTSSSWARRVQQQQQRRLRYGRNTRTCWCGA